MAKRDTREVKSNQDMAFSLDNIANEADIPTTTGNNNAYVSTPSVKKVYGPTETDNIIIAGTKNNYSFTEEQYDALLTSFENKKSFVNGMVKVLDSDNEMIRSVMGNIAFVDIYQRLELQAETSQCTSEDVCHLNTSFLDDENQRYSDKLGDKVGGLLIPAAKIRKVASGLSKDDTLRAYISTD